MGLFSKKTVACKMRGSEFQTWFGLDERSMQNSRKRK